MKNTMPLKFNGTNVATSIRCPETLPQRIDALLAYIEKEKGVRISRNSYILKSISFYTSYLESSPDMDEALKRIYTIDTD